MAALFFSACAHGNSVGPGNTGGGGEGGIGPGGSGGSGAGGATIGKPCDSDGKCEKGHCIQIGNGKYCSQTCPPACPMGTYCSFVNGATICVPDLDQECQKCIGTVDCKLPTDECLTAPEGDKFCARDCTVLGDCPNGFDCVESAGYPPMEMDGGAGGAGGTGGVGGMGGAMPPPKGPHKYCVPIANQSCTCDKKRDGVTKACHDTNNFGDCVGTETCNAKSGMFEGCNASTPVDETCNGKDDNCNMEVDEGDPNLLCSALGPKPPHANWACTNAQCKLGACDPGYHPYPPGPASDGCPCQDEAMEPNGTCALAINAGTVDDSAGAALILKGTLSADNDVDFWTFNTVDIDEAVTNSYHVSIHFLQPMPNSEFVMDVQRGGCVDAPAGPGTSITDYDWCVNGSAVDANNVAIGEAPCSATGSVHCTDHSAPYFVRVYRKNGSMGTCTEYQIQVLAKGGAGCDFGQTCP